MDFTVNRMSKNIIQILKEVNCKLQLNIVQRDIKSKNIMLSKKNNF